MFMLEQLLQFDQTFHELLPHNVIGIDEVGRGCLAGPVVAAAVCLPRIGGELVSKLELLNDSKKVSPKLRELLAEVIQKEALYAIAEASVEEIDELNILNASLLAMKRARRALKTVTSAVLLVDGNKPIPGISDPQIPVIGGDGKSAAIACASIIAKVYRDKLMTHLGSSFKHYCFDHNKGYASKEHIQAIEVHGATHLHRKIFILGLTRINQETVEATLGNVSGVVK
jgi:ribonuclease HII